MTCPESIEIRKAGPDDAAAVHALVVQLAASIPSHFTMRSTVDDFASALVGDAPAIHALLAEQGETNIGILLFFTTFSTWYGTPGIYVQDIYVDPNARGTGTGHRLLAAACQWGAQQGADHLRLSADRDNKPAQAFYEQHGMRRCDDEFIYMIEGEDFLALGEQV